MNISQQEEGITAIKIVPGKILKTIFSGLSDIFKGHSLKHPLQLCI